MVSGIEPIPARAAMAKVGIFSNWWVLLSHRSNDAARTFPDIGDMITLKASDYFDGNNDLSLRLVHLPGELLRIPSLEWVQLQGHCVVGWQGPDQEF